MGLYGKKDWTCEWKRYDKEIEKEKKQTDKNSKKEKIRNINEYHKVLGHPSEDTAQG